MRFPIFAERSPLDLSTLDFSSVIAINGPDLAGISLLVVIFAGLMALRLGINLKDY